MVQGVGQLEYSGGSAAQSPSIQIIDAGLGIQHHQAEGDFLRSLHSILSINSSLNAAIILP